MSVFVDIAGNVGIGTKYPINKFNVVGKSSFTGDLLPSSCNVYDLGFSNLCWRDLYLSGNKINIAGTKISKDENTGGLQILPPGYSNVNANYTYNGSNIILPSSIATINGVNITALNKRTRTSYATAFDSIKSWTLIYIDGTADWYSMCWSPELSALVAVGSDTLSAGGPSQPPTSIVTSYDYGKTWISTTPYNTWDAHFSVCWSSELSLFVAVGTNILTSSDGSSWVYRQTDNRGWKSVCWSSELSLFVAVGDIQDSNDIITSANGIDWTYRTVPEINTWKTVCWSPELSLFVAAGAIADQLTYGFMTSANGISWQLHSSYINTSCVVTSICWSPELSIFVFGGVSGSDNIVITLSPNLTVLYSASIFANYSQYTYVCWSAELSLFVMTGIGVLISSPNGINWTTSSQPAVSNDPVSLCWIPELSCFMASMALGQILRSAIALPNAKSVVKALPSQMMVDAFGNVSIGTNNPNQDKLVVGGNILATGNVIANSNIGIGTINPTSALHIVGNVLATGTITASNINVIGDFIPLNTVTSNTEQVVVTNAGTGPALKVTQTGNHSVAEFYDNESGIALFVGNNGNVGVGTTNPQATLHIRPNTSSTGVIIDQVGTGSILDIKDGGVSKVIVDTNGNVGIGTTIPQATLHVNGTLYSPGSVIQIETYVYTGADSYSGSTFADINASFGVTITPKFVNSKFLIQGMLHIGGQQSTDARFTFFRLARIVNSVATEIGNGTNTTTANIGTPCIAAHNWGAAGTAEQDYNTHIANISIIYVDTPNTSNAITYRFRWGPNPGGTGSRVCYINRTHSHADAFRPNTISTITVTEIAQ